MNITHNILLKIMMSITLLLLLNHHLFSQDNTQDDNIWVAYIQNPVHSFSIEQVNATLQDYQDERIDDGEYTVNKALLLFRKALLTFTEENTLFAFEYWKTLYANDKYRSPIHLVYMGSLEAMHGGSILSPEPIKKINWANRGIKKMQTGIDELTQEDNIIALSYAYFLQGNTYVQLPTFFKEFPQTPDSLKMSLKGFSKIRKQKLIDDEELLFLVSYTYYIYGNYYLKTGDIKRAKKYYTSAKKYLQESNPDAYLQVEIEAKINDLQ